MQSYKQFVSLLEGNFLGRLVTNNEKGRHFSIMSAERAGLSDQENSKRHKELKSKINSLGYPHRETEGHWEGGKEKSIIVHAKGVGDEHGSNLRNDINELGKHYGQDSVFHYNPKESNGHLIGTNETGYPGLGKREDVGKLKFNSPESPFQTEVKPRTDSPLKSGRTGKSAARFTTE